ncbi:hypothetical protein ATERTT37_007269 [Aspergillus terreus]
MGLLLHYEDGSCESVGQFRWDQRISERIPAAIRLHVGRLGPWKKNQRFVLHVQSAVDVEARLPWGRWVDVPASGFLVWWSGRIGDVVEMPTFYPSIPPDLRDWALRQSVFFVASAPLRGRHINLSPKGLPDSSFAILGPNEAAYVDATGSGSETISHVRENGRLTVMFCSFDPTPRILRFFSTAEVIEWDEPRFASELARMGGKRVLGARAVIRLDVFKVQRSCGYGVPLLALTPDPDPRPYLKDRETMGHWASKKVEGNVLHEYQRLNNSASLDGLPGLRSALKDAGRSVWAARLGNWASRHRDEIEMVKSVVLIVLVAVLIGQWWNV